MRRLWPTRRLRGCVINHYAVERPLVKGLTNFQPGGFPRGPGGFPRAASAVAGAPRAPGSGPRVAGSSVAPGNDSVAGQRWWRHRLASFERAYTTTRCRMRALAPVCSLFLRAAANDSDAYERGDALRPQGFWRGYTNEAAKPSGGGVWRVGRPSGRALPVQSGTKVPVF